MGGNGSRYDKLFVPLLLGRALVKLCRSFEWFCGVLRASLVGVNALLVAFLQQKVVILQKI